MTKSIRELVPYLGFNPTGDLGPFTIYTSKRAGTVFYNRAPPLEPPSEWQTYVRNKFRLVAYLWRSMTPDKRAAWAQAARLAHLRITGYNLYVHMQVTGDRDTIASVSRVSGVDLLANT
jgi:hypothetical protein